jgi:hypothetical protein
MRNYKFVFPAPVNKSSTGPNEATLLLARRCHSTVLLVEGANPVVPAVLNPCDGHQDDGSSDGRDFPIIFVHTSDVPQESDN